MDNTNMAEGMNFAEDMKKLEELKKQYEMTQSAPPVDLSSVPNLQPPTSMDTGAIPNVIPTQIPSVLNAGASTAPSPANREDVLQQYMDSKRAEIAGQQGRLDTAKSAYDKSQAVDEGWKANVAKGLGIFADTMSAMGGGKSNYTSDVMKGYAGQKAAGETKYSKSLEHEAGILKDYKDILKNGTVEQQNKLKANLTDSTSQESVAARKFAKDTLGIDLPENTSAIQAKIYVDQKLKQEQYQGANAEKANATKETNAIRQQVANDTRDYRRELLNQKSETAANKPSMFAQATEKKQAENYAKTQEAMPMISKNIDRVDEAIDSHLDYSKNHAGGTGPLAQGFGLKQYVSEDAQNLQAKLKEINLKNMVSTFSGMSKAVDSNAERRAWESTQAGLTNDDSVNLNILYGAKSSLLKDKAVAQAQQDYVAQNGNLNGFEQSNPILQGKVTTIVDPSGNMQLVPKEQLKSLEGQGYKNVDNYVKSIVKNNFTKPEVQSAGLPVGTIKSGYKFLGGNPNDKNSWEKQ